MTESASKINHQSEKCPDKISEALKVHAKKHQGQRVDAKTILLVDTAGTVQEPTSQTLQLLGVRTSAKFRKAKAAETLKEGASPDEDEIALLGFARLGKRFRGGVSASEEVETS